MGASASAAAGGQSEHVFESGSPSTAVNLLERYLNGHQGLKQKAGELGNSSRTVQHSMSKQDWGDTMFMRCLLVRNVFITCVF
jgi:hypothetical protein